MLWRILCEYIEYWGEKLTENRNYFNDNWLDKALTAHFGWLHLHSWLLALVLRRQQSASEIS